jgi:glyoxylase-like metal-dependent hydrolase (beta-lactamase superfamily II)
MQILPGVYLVNGFPYGRHQNGYLLKTPSGPIVIDSGDMEEGSFDTVEAACRLWGFDVRDVSHLIVTHAHFDHASHAARFSSMGAAIVASRDTADAMAAGDDRCVGYAVGRRFDPCRADVTIDDNETMDIGGISVRGIAAPGHARGLMAFEVTLADERLWFCGDLLKVGAECESVELGWPGGPDYDRPVYLETLRRLAHMECDTLLPGHGPPGIRLGERLIQMAYAKAMAEWPRGPRDTE